MAADLAGFRARFPEFNGVGDAYINTQLGDAQLQVDPAVWNLKTDLGVYYLTAHTLALSPFGNSAKLVAKDGKTTTYGAKYRELQLAVASGGRVVGGRNV